MNRVLTACTLSLAVLFLVGSVAAQEPIAVELVHGQPWEPEPSLEALTASECDALPFVQDVRPDDHSSLAVLPRLGSGDFETLQAFYHFEVRDDHGCRAAEPGQRYWDLYGVEFKCGPAILQPQVFDEAGELITDVGILMFLHWPGSDPFPAVVDPPYAQTGVAGFTEGGSVGWGFSGESHIGADGGPFMVWASSDPVDWPNRVVYSDALDRVGWWDDHCVPNSLMRKTVKSGEVLPDDGYELVNYDKEGNQNGRIKFLTSTPASGFRLSLFLDGLEIGHVLWETNE